VAQPTSTPTDEIRIIHAGLVEYHSALATQREIHSEVSQSSLGNTLILLEHPSVYTAGRRTLDSEKPIDGTPVVEVDRGGKITWHGPGQLVGYPIVRLANPHELVGFVRTIEAALIKVCAEFGIATQCISKRSGVWVVDDRVERKIAASGIRVAKGVTMHGFALNVNPDMSAFGQIIPCGIADADVTSLAKELGRDISVSEVAPLVQRHMIDALGKVSA